MDSEIKNMPQGHMAVPPTRWERFLFGAFLFLLPFQTRIFLVDLSGTGTRLPDWTGAWLWLSDIALGALIIFWVRRGMGVRDLRPLAFLLLFIPSLVVYPTALAFWTTLKIGEGMLLFSFARKHRDWLMTSALWPFFFLIGLSVNALVGLAQFVAQRDIGLQILDESPLDPSAPGTAKILVSGSRILRAYGVTPHPNILGALMFAGITIVAFLYIFRGVRRLRSYSGTRQREELIRGLFLFFCFTGLLVSFSRSAWLATAVFFTALLPPLFLHRSLRTHYAAEAARFTLLFVSIIVSLFLVFRPFLEARIDIKNDPQATDLRVFYAQQAVGMIREHPLVGVGPGQFTQALLERNADMPLWKAQPVHNVVLLLAAENGLPVMFVLVVAFMSFFLATWHRVVAIRDPVVQLMNICLLAFATGLLFLSLGDHLLWTSQQGRLLFWLTLGLLAA